MPDRVARLEEKVDKLTELLSQVVGEIKDIKGPKPGTEEGEPEAPVCAPGDYYSLYCLLFDEWTRGNQKFVLKRLREMDVEELGKFITGARLPIEEKKSKAAMLDSLKDVFEHLTAKQEAEQYSGLLCLLTEEWHHCNYPFVEGRLNELNTRQLKALAAANNIGLKKTAKRETVINAIKKLLQEKKPLVDATPRKARDPQKEHYQYVHSVLFDEWNQGNLDYVSQQLQTQTVERLHGLIKANNLPVEMSDDKDKMIAGLKEVYTHLKTQAKNDQLTGLLCLLQNEWNCGNKPFVERRLMEMEESKLRDLTAASAISAPAKAGKMGLIKAVKTFLKEAPPTPAKP